MPHSVVESDHDTTKQSFNGLVKYSTEARHLDVKAASGGVVLSISGGGETKGFVLANDEDIRHVIGLLEKEMASNRQTRAGVKYARPPAVWAQSDLREQLEKQGIFPQKEQSGMSDWTKSNERRIGFAEGQLVSSCYEGLRDLYDHFSATTTNPDTQVAEILGVDQETASRRLKGPTNLDLTTLAGLVFAMGGEIEVKIKPKGVQ